MRKICVVVASRANYGRIKTVLQAIKDHDDLELQLVVAASALLYNYGKVIDIIKRDGFKVDSVAYIVIEGNNLEVMSKSTGLAIMELSSIFKNLNPDVVLTVADRYETMATAITASYMNIPLAHTQGGEITGTIDNKVRDAITKLADIHFPATELSRKRLIKMGEDPEKVFMTGCPAIDIVAHTDKKLPEGIFSNTGTGSVIDVTKPYIMVLQHPVTTEYDSTSSSIQNTISAIEALKVQTIWLWPNIDAGSDVISKSLRELKVKKETDYVHFVRNFSPEDYIKVLSNCACLVGNSSSGIREGAYLGVPVVNIGSRQNARERAVNVTDVDNNSTQILDAIKKQLEHKKYESNHLYGDGTAGKQIANVLATCELTIEKKNFL